MFFALSFLLSFLLAFLSVPIVAHIARLLNVQDYPLPPLKNHLKPTPLLGGIVVFLSLVLVVLFLKLLGVLNINNIVFGIILGGAILLFGGILDDIYNLSPKYQILAPILAVIVVVLFGVGQDNITNPFYYIGLSSDPLIHLNVKTIYIWNTEITLFTDIFTFLWIFLLIYTTKFLDGLNGLVSGISVIGSILLFLASMSLGQILPAYLSLIVGGAYLGFLPFNFSGKIFLGESGSTLAGFLLGVLAVLGPAKISIAFLIIGIPILDALWVIYERIFLAKKSPFKGDLRHMHFRLLKRGFSSKQAVLMLWGISLSFGLFGLSLQGVDRFILSLSLFFLMFLLIRYTKDTANNPVEMPAESKQ